MRSDLLVTIADPLTIPVINVLSHAMKQTKQGVRSTQIVDEDAMLGFKPQPGVKHKDV